MREINWNDPLGGRKPISHLVPMRALGLWRRFMCKRGYHALDEVHSSDGEIYLWCDACSLSVYVEVIREDED